jgi:hypothetical protein
VEFVVEFRNGKKTKNSPNTPLVLESTWWQSSTSTKLEGFTLQRLFQSYIHIALSQLPICRARVQGLATENYQLSTLSCVLSNTWNWMDPFLESWCLILQVELVETIRLLQPKQCHHAIRPAQISLVPSPWHPSTCKRATRSENNSIKVRNHEVLISYFTFTNNIQ